MFSTVDTEILPVKARKISASANTMSNMARILARGWSFRRYDFLLRTLRSLLGSAYGADTYPGTLTSTSQNALAR
jgi:hypothetical protein